MSVPLPPPVEFDSPEEIHFSWWLEELVSAGYVHRWARGQSYALVPSIVQEYLKERTSPATGLPLPPVTSKVTLKQGLTYTPDFEIYWTFKALGVFCVPHRLLTVGAPSYHLIGHYDDSMMPFSLVEVKPRIAGGKTGANNGRMRVSRMNAMILYHVHGLYANLAEVGPQPGSIFAKTFTPGRFLKTDKSGKPRTLKFQPRDLSGFVAETPKLKIRTHS